MTPHRISASVEYSRQLLLQSSVDIETFIRDDLMAIIGLKTDRLALEGSGSDNQPTGILATDGIGSMTFDGAPTWAKVVSFETALAQQNVTGPNICFLTTPTVCGVWKVTPRVAASAFPVFIWENGDAGDPANDGVANGYKAAATNQLSDQGTVIQGRWSDLVIAFWGAPDVVVNPFSRDVDAITRITISVWMDVAVCHAQAFVVSADSGAQS